MLSLLRRPQLRRLWLGEAISLLGDWLSYVALSVVALEQGQGAMALAVVFAAHVLPTALLSPFAGVLVDRHDRRRVLVGTQLLQGLVMLAILAAVATGAVIAAQLLLFVRTGVAAFFAPARQAAVAATASDHEIVDWSALDAATWSVTFALGTALGGLLAAIDPIVALGLDALTFAAAAAVLARLTPLPPSRPPSHDRAWAAEWVEPTRAMMRAPALFEAVFAKLPIAFAGGAGFILLHLVAEDVVVGAAALGIGAFHAARGVGAGLGPLQSRALLGRGLAAPHLSRAASMLTLVGIALFGALASQAAPIAALLLAAVIWGAGAGASWALASIELMRHAPPRVMGRLAATDQLAFTTTQTLGAFAAAWLANLAGPGGVTQLAVAGGALALIALLLARRSLAGRLLAVARG
ncbi:MAG: MFS transporter [Polyangiaceae bacterium]